MRIDVRNATRSHAVISSRPLWRPSVPCRTFVSRRRSPEDFQDEADAIYNHFPLIDPRLFEKRSQPNPEARNIAIIGGGISGLSTAYFISKDIPQAKITIFEQSNQLGGWINSEKIEVDSGEVLFEWGPRSLRPDPNGAGSFTWMMLREVLEDSDTVIGISKKANASRNRFIYYRDRLTKMPGLGNSIFTTVRDTLYKLLTEPIFKGLIPSVLAEPSKNLRSSSTRDESVGDFVRRRFGRTVSDNLTSALFHGIYAGNIDKLSARTLIPRVWYLETRERDKPSGILWNMANLAFRQLSIRDYRLQRGSSLTGLQQRGQRLEMHKENDFTFLDRQQHVDQALLNSSMYTLSDGLQRLSNAIISRLSENPNINFSTSTNVHSLSYNTDDRSFSIATQPSSPPHNTVAAHRDTNSSSTRFDYTIATIRPSNLLAMLSASPKPINIPGKAKSAFSAVSRSVNVMVINLYYTSPTLLPRSLEGFGYLIPASVSLDENPERALGVVFSSNASGVRGPDAIRRDHRQTAEELKSLRENLERKYESDYHRARKLKFIEAYQQRIKDDPEHFDNHVNVNGESILRSLRSDLKAYESSLQFHINKLKHQEKDARKREEQPGFDPEENYDERRVGQDTATGTKLAVMIGGHWWDDWEESDLPTEEEGIEKAKSLLARHLKITEEPEVAKARLQRNCIPQYPVGYRDYMATIHQDVLASMGGGFDGRLKVAGTWWQGGVGVNDCVRKAKETAVSVYEGWDQCTGLEEYVGDEKWCLVDNRTGQVRPDMMSINR